MPSALALLALPLLVLAPPWQWPVDPPHVILRPYIAPETPYSAGHRGVDLAAPGGTVRAPADGVVHFAGTVVDRPVLSIEHPGGVLSSYEPVQTWLVAGDSVRSGEPIGVVVPGHCSAPCVHVGVRVHGEYASPLAWLGGLERAVLLPTRGHRERGELMRESSPRVESHGSGQLSTHQGERSPLASERMVRRARPGDSNQLHSELSA